MAMFMAMKGTSVLQWISWCMLLLGFIGTTNALVEYERSGSCDVSGSCITCVHSAIKSFHYN